MAEEIRIRQSAPTLAGIKTGELVFLSLRGSRGTDDGYPAAVAQGALPAAPAKAKSSRMRKKHARYSRNTENARRSTAHFGKAA